VSARELADIARQARAFSTAEHDPGTVALARLVASALEVLVAEREDECLDDAISRIFGGER
jgi:hypothetical protein